MVRPLQISLIALFLWATFGLPETGLAQIIIPGGGIGYPGGYPGGGYPGGGGMGIPFPGRNRGQQQNQPTQNFVGTIRQISTTNMTIEGDDHLITQMQISNSTRYFLVTGNNGRNRDFQPGDQVSVDATQDINNNIYRTVRVTQLRQGTPEDRAAAEKPADSSSGSSSTGDDDPDRPRLRRAPSSDSSGSGSQTASSASNSSSSTSDDGPPRLRRADDSSAAPSSVPPQTASAQASSSPPASYPPPQRDADDPGAPVLRRGQPQASSASSQPVQMADSRPSIHADDSNGVTRLPDAPRVDTGSGDGSAPYHAGGGNSGRMPRSGDEVIDQAREAAFEFTETLPNYVVKQFTTRYATQSAAGNHTSWRPLDTVTADVICENGTEKYKNILVDGRAPKGGNIENTGSWSSGEFSSLLQDVLSPLTNADFHGKRATRIANRDAFKYDFSVEQPNSHWHVSVETQSYLPAYNGTIWIDKETFRALRVELSAQAMPRSFPLDTVESAVDYDFVLIGDSKFLLPVHSEALSCERGTSDCTRNVIDFRNYKKFTADSSITFGSDN